MTAVRFALIYLWFTAAAGALGGLLFGYDWVVIGGAKPFYERFFHLDSPALQGWAMSCALIGCLFGAVSSGSLEQSLWKAPPAHARCRCVRGFFSGNGARPQLFDFCCVAHLRRLRYRTRLRCLAHVHRRDFAGAPARQAGFPQPGGHRLRDTAGAGSQLADRAARSAGCFGKRDSLFLERTSGMALDVRGHRHSIAALPGGFAAGAREPALAGVQRTS